MSNARSNYHCFSTYAILDLYTSDFDFDLFIFIDMAFRIGIPNLTQIIQRMAKSQSWKKGVEM